MKLNIKIDLNRFQVNTEGKSAAWAAVLMGLFFFLRAVVYFAFVNLKEIGTANLIFSLILPMLFTGGCMLCLRGFRFTRPIIYGGVTVGITISLLLASFEMTGFNVVLNFILILAAALLLEVHCLGVWNVRLYSSMVFAAALICRVIWHTIPMVSAKADVTMWLFEIGSLCLNGAMIFLPLTFQNRK